MVAAGQVPPRICLATPAPSWARGGPPGVTPNQVATARPGAQTWRYSLSRRGRDAGTEETCAKSRGGGGGSVRGLRARPCRAGVPWKGPVVWVFWACLVQGDMKVRGSGDSAPSPLTGRVVRRGPTWRRREGAAAAGTLAAGGPLPLAGTCGKPPGCEQCPTLGGDLWGQLGVALPLAACPEGACAGSGMSFRVHLKPPPSSPPTLVLCPHTSPSGPLHFRCAHL